MTSVPLYSSLRKGIDDAAFYATEHQLALANLLKTHPRWRLKHKEGTAEFLTRTGRITTATVHPIGMMDAHTWTWAWADKRLSTFPNDAAHQVHQFGLESSINPFTHASFSLGADYTRVTPEQLMVCAKNIHRIWLHFIFKLSDTTQLYAALNLPKLQLPPVTTATIQQTINTAQSILPITRPRRALVSYARLRGITYQENRSRTRIRLLLTDTYITATWGSSSTVTLETGVL